VGPVALLVLTLAAATPAVQAHAPERVAVPAPLGAWSLEPWVVLPLMFSAALYAIGISRLWRNAGAGRGITRGQVAAFAAGWLALVLALMSPLDGLGSRLFSAHMVQHEVLMLVAAPLLVLGRPLAAWAWAFTPAGRRNLGRWLRVRWWSGTWSVLTDPLAAWALHALALWAWHIPDLFEAALRSPWVHVLQHASFLFSALLFWWAVLGADVRSRKDSGYAMVYLFTTMLHTGALGALLTLAPTPWYPSYAAATGALGLDPVEDQQLGGLVMWVPGGLAYLAAGLAVVSRLLTTSSPRQRQGLNQPSPALVPPGSLPRPGRYSQPTHPSQPHSRATSSITSKR
jgi:putative membrane protein